MMHFCFIAHNCQQFLWRKAEERKKHYTLFLPSPSHLYRQQAESHCTIATCLFLVVSPHYLVSLIATHVDQSDNRNQNGMFDCHVRLGFCFWRTNQKGRCEYAAVVVPMTSLCLSVCQSVVERTKEEKRRRKAHLCGTLGILEHLNVIKSIESERKANDKNDIPSEVYNEHQLIRRKHHNDDGAFSLH